MSVSLLCADILGQIKDQMRVFSPQHCHVTGELISFHSPSLGPPFCVVHSWNFSTVWSLNCINRENLHGCVTISKISIVLLLSVFWRMYIKFKYLCIQ